MIDGSSFKKIIWNLENRRAMYLVDNKYNSVCAFLIGYGLALKDSGQSNVMQDFQTWLQNREGKYFSFHWSAYILKEMAQGDEQKSKMHFI